MNNFFQGKRVLITGHTGFKGTWLTHILLECNAEVTGYSLNIPTTPSLFELSGVRKHINSVQGDIRNREQLEKLILDVRPEIIIHLAAQPLVLQSYKDPVKTYETNVMGTVNVLECIRKTDFVRSFLNVTTDKVYKNNEWGWGYREDDVLNGWDPYSNSKSCSELITSCYKNSLIDNHMTAISTARAGNVIGGGDFSENRIIPDCIKAIQEGKEIKLRNPNAIRPYQHVLDALFAYLMIIEKQYENKNYANCYNVGPDETECITNKQLIVEFTKKWAMKTGKTIRWTCENLNVPHETSYLKLDSSKLRNVFSWKPCWNMDTALNKVVDWTYCYLQHEDIEREIKKEIEEYSVAFSQIGK